MEFSVARRNMVESQIRPNGITNQPLISALLEVEREAFVDKEYQSIAYFSEDLPLQNNRFLLEPMVLGRLLQLAEIKSDDLVLDIGPGSGYSTAVIAQLAQSVIGVEEDESLCDKSGGTLIDRGITNAAIVCGKHSQGVPGEAPFDVIVLNGRVPQVPQALFDQLACGGRLVAVVGHEFEAKVTLYTKTDQEISALAAFNAFAPLLIGFEPTKVNFTF